MNNDQNKAGQQTQPAPQKQNDQQQKQGAQQGHKTDATKPDAAKASEGADHKSPSTDGSKS